MPFTFAHPAIILPLNQLSKRWFSLTGLVVGSLTPDFEYFIRMKISSRYGHSYLGLFWLDLPLGILLAFGFHYFVRNSLFKNLPAFLQQRLMVFTNFDWFQYFKRNWLIVVTSILIGGASHIFWDSFTHPDGYFVNQIPALQNEIEVQGMKIESFRFLQHLSTLVGGLIIIAAIFRMPAQGVHGKINFRYWTTILLVIILTLAIRFAFGIKLKNYGDIIVSVISAVLISLLVSPLMLRKEAER